jgi:peptidyl-prolyl cis-trans isomerase C
MPPPPPPGAQPNKTSIPIPLPATSKDGTPAPQPHVEMSIENPGELKMPVVPPDKVVLSVGDVKLTAAQFDQIIDFLPEQVRSAARGPGRKQFGDNLVRMLVLAQEAKNRKLDESAAYRDQAAFQASNLLATLMFQQIAKDVKVDDADLRKYYAEHRSEFDQVSARHILVRMQGSPISVKPGQKDLTPEEALAKCQELERRIKAGEDFAKLATDESDDAGSAGKGGDLGSFKHGTMVPSFDQAAFELAPGQVSEPVKSQFGYHIIKVESAKTFDDVKADVQKRVAPELAQKSMEDLQKKSVVVYDTEFFNMAKR